MKNTKLAGLAAAAFIAFTLTACSGGAAQTETSAATETETVEVAPAEDTTAPATSGQTLTEACLAIAGPLSQAAITMAESAQATITSPQTAVDAWTDLTNAFATISTDTQNAEVKSAATAAHTDLAAVRDAMQKVFVDQNMGAMSEYTTAVENMNTSYSAFVQLCS